MTKILTHWLTVLITLAVLIGLRFQDGGLTETARLKSFDYLQSTDAKEIDGSTIRFNGFNLDPS